ncbi:MAG: isochorismatase family cysteine hydrolase [Betaproteobacteria bacterium]|jgi:nicotinamidase-related amidase
MNGLMVEMTALLVIDMQRDFLDARGYAAKAGLDIAPLQAAVPAVHRLLDAARAAGLMIVHTREGHVPDLSDCPPYKLARSRNAGAEIGSPGPLGRLLVRGEAGHDFTDELRPAPGEIVIDKPGYSAFAHTDLDHRLRVRGIDTLLICGITTEVCVSSTLRDAVDRGYRCITIGDACASGFADLHDAALRMIAVEGGIFGSVMNSEQACSALARSIIA